MTTLEAGTVRALERDVIDHPHEDRYRLIYADWLEDHGGSVRAEHMRGQTAAWDCHQALWVGGVMVGLFPGKVRLGFVEMLRMLLADWRQYGPRLVRAHPLTRVELSCRSIVPWRVQPTMPGVPPLELPYVARYLSDPPLGEVARFHGKLRDLGLATAWATEEAGVAAISDALLAWARLPANAPRAD